MEELEMRPLYMIISIHWANFEFGERCIRGSKTGMGMDGVHLSAISTTGQG
jgi:hypothetical protein